MDDSILPTYSVLLAGGTGTRLWPVSRQLYPKQLVKFIGSDSLVQSTIKRLTPMLGDTRIRIVCGRDHFHETARHMQEIGIGVEDRILSEPCGRNTAPAILLAILDILRTETDAVLSVFPADHVIKNADRFRKKLEDAIGLARKDYIVTFGIEPHYPETGYGYIEGGRKLEFGGLKIKRFVEKPDRQTAEDYIAAGNFFWNSGMFAFKASAMIEEFKRHQPALLRQMQEILTRTEAMTLDDYARLEDISIDYAIMEKTDRGVVLPSDFGWSDIGSWKSLYDFLDKDGENNVIDGDVITQDTRDCFLMARERLIAANHLRNTVVVETPDAIFVSDLENSRDVKSIVSRLKDTGRWEYQKHKTVYHPWGSLTMLEMEVDYQLMRLMIYPGAQVEVRTESESRKHLSVIKGTCRIAEQGGFRILTVGETISLNGGSSATLANEGPRSLGLIQVKIG